MSVKYMEASGSNNCAKCHLVEAGLECDENHMECEGGYSGYFVEDDDKSYAMKDQEEFQEEITENPCKKVASRGPMPEFLGGLPTGRYLALQDLKGSALDVQEGGDHYKKMAIQPIEFCQKNRLNACETSIVKYACRHQDKNGAEDIRKIIHYAQLILEMEYPNG